MGGPIAFQTFDPVKQVQQASLPKEFTSTVSCIASCYSAGCLLCQQPIFRQLVLAANPQPSEFLLSGALGAGFVVALAVLRIYLGWSYVGDRLLSAAVPYEETGWSALSDSCVVLYCILDLDAMASRALQ